MNRQLELTEFQDQFERLCFFFEGMAHYKCVYQGSIFGPVISLGSLSLFRRKTPLFYRFRILECLLCVSVCVVFRRRIVRSLYYTRHVSFVTVRPAVFSALPV